MLDASLPPMPDHITEGLSRYSALMQRVRDATDRSDITAAQALLIMSLGNQSVKASELIRRGHYAGTNASYNISVLEDAGYIRRENVPGDKRQKLVALTDKGIDLCIHLRRKLAIKEREAA